MIVEDRLPSAAEYEFIRQLVYTHSRINLGADKIHLVGQRIHKRLRLIGLPTYRDYCLYLKSPEGEEELTNLLDVISTNVTSFFREEEHFEFLAGKVLVDWLAQGAGGPFRLWSAACSSGEEPYTAAIVIDHFFRGHPSHPWEVTASDISTRMLERAARGIYRREQVKLPQADWLRKYFLKGSNGQEDFCRVKNEIRERVAFHHLNLFQPTLPFNHLMDIIFCRNVMIYFDQKTQEQLISRLSAQLRPGGYLIVGHSESLIGIKHSLQTVRPSIYQNGKVARPQRSLVTP